MNDNSMQQIDNNINSVSVNNNSNVNYTTGLNQFEKKDNNIDPRLSYYQNTPSSSKNKKLKYISITLISILIIFIGISRIYLGVHYTSDVLAGFLFSISYLIIFILIANNKVLNKNSK